MFPRALVILYVGTRSFFIMRLLVPRGMFSSVDLGCLGLCLDE
jgi:hypothetical protein